MTQYAEVAVWTDAPYRHPFTYSVPAELALSPGQGVLVPFGPRTLQGVVLAISSLPSFEGTVRPLEGVATELPILPPHLLELARWVAERYLAPLFSCIAPLLPPGVERRTRIRLVPGEVEPASEQHEAIVSSLREGRAGDLAELQKELKSSRLRPTVERLVRQGILKREFSLDPPSTRPRMVQCLRLTGSAEQVDVAGPFFRLLQAAGGMLPLASLRQRPDWSEPALRLLTEAGLAEQTEERLYRDPLAGQELPLEEPPVLTAAQSAALDAIHSRGSPPLPSLLHGVTGSGKTEVYLAAAAATLAAGRQVIALVPEISLTPQTIERFAGRFPGRVAVLHSGLSAGQRYDQWCGIRDGRFDVVVGSRSAIFAPLARPGLIVIDEEHEWTYKQQDPQPRYQTRDVATKLAGLTGASLVLGSATPDVTSYYRALRGRYRLIELPDRVRPRPGRAEQHADAMPVVEVVDLARELREGNRGIFSRALTTALTASLARGEQALLFLNRRGSASFVLCRDCGHVPHCLRCAVSLTLHAEGDRLICHQCGRARRAPPVCPRCRSPRIRRLGLGTQRVVEEVERNFAGARVVRWDRDSARSATDHGEIYGALQREEADVVVGTQMVAKGLDLPKLSLVGIVNADLSLNLPDYYSAERAFQLLTQVAGRAGRRDLQGRAILQTYAPNHYAVRAASMHDYRSFFDKEIEYRRRSGYPPFARLTRLVHAHSNAARAEAEARRLAAELRGAVAEGKAPSTEIIGPAPCRTPRLRGRWRWQLLIRSARPALLLDKYQLPAGWSIDVDPHSFG